MENQVELENNNQPQPPTYTKGLFLNLQQAFGKENLPDEATFTKKITTDKVYRDGVHKNLIAAYGQDNVPDLSTFDSKILGNEVKKKEPSVPIEKPSEIFAKTFQSVSTEKAAPVTSELGAGEEAPIVPSWKMTGKQPLAVESTYLRPTTKIDIEKKQQIKETHEKALNNTAERRLQAKGISLTKDNIDKEKIAVDNDIKKGILSYHSNTKTYQRDAGFIEGFLRGFNRNLINASYGITKGINAALGNDNTEKEKRQKAELESIERDPYGSMLHSFNVFKTDEDKRLLEVAKKTGGTELSYEGMIPSLGSLGGDIAYFSPTNLAAAGLPKIGTALAMGYTKNYGERSNEIYNQLKSEGYNDEDAAKKASIDATAQAIPHTIFEAALFGGVIPHAKPAKDFLSSVAQMAKRTALFSAANAPVQGLDEAIKSIQGYDTTGWEGRIKDAVVNGMGMVALMEGLPILAKLPKYAKSAFKEYANNPDVRPVVDEFLKTQPNGEEIKQQLDNYKVVTEPLRGIVPDEKMPSIGGLQEQRNNINSEINTINESIKNLEQSKKDSSPGLANKYDELIKKQQETIIDKQNQIDLIDKKIKTFDMSDNPIEQEVDDATGQKLSEKPIEVTPEAKPTEVTTTTVTPTEVKTTAEAIQPEAKITIDSESLKKNTQPEVDRVKNLPLENEDGATFNLNGTKHEGGLVVPVESLNTTRAELTPELINDFVEKNKDKISGDNFKVGIYKFPNSEKVSIDLNIVVDPKFKDAALEFGKLAGQESLFDLDSLENVKTGATGENPRSFTSKEFFDIAKSLAKGEVPEVVKLTEAKEEAPKMPEEFTKKEIINKYPELENTKAVDEKGKPILVYHGGIKFDDFKPSQTKEDKGIYFTDNKDLALYFAHQAELLERDKRGDDYSDIPNDLLESGEPFPEKYLKYAKVHRAYLDMKNPTVVDAIDAKSIPKNYEPNSDGFIAKTTGDFGYKGGQYVVFEPNQIKKAEGITPSLEAKVEAPKTIADKVADDLFTHLGIEPEVKEGEVKFSKTTGEPEVIKSRETKEQEVIDEMNKLDLVNKGIDLNPTSTTKEKIDVNELNSRLDNPLETVEWQNYEGIPFGFTISDQLRTGEVKNPNTGETIADLKGGIGFNGTKGNENNAWANTTKEEAQAMLQRAEDIYNNNKPLFEKLWKEGKLPDGHIPIAVVKMAETSILSNEAVFRAGIQNIETLPKSNRKKAVSELSKSIKTKMDTESASLKRGVDKNGKPYTENTVKLKKKTISQYQKILDSIKENKYEDIVDVLKDKDHFSLPEKALIANEVFYGSPTPIGGKEIDISRSRPSTSVSKVLIGDKNPALINLGKITDLLTEPSMKNVPNMHIVSIVGIDVKNPEVTNVNHKNYKYGVKGKSIGILEQPVHMKDAFGEAYGSILSQIVKNEAANNSISPKLAMTQGIPVQAGLPNRIFKSAIAKGRLDVVDKLSGFLRQAFPETTFFTSKEAWDAAMADPNIKKKLKDGDVVYAFTTDGNVFINPNLKTTKATLHETGHIWMGYVEENNPTLHKKGLDLVTDTKEFKKAVEQYGDTPLAREEALMELMSSKGDTIVNAAQKAKFKEWLLSVYKYIADNFKSLMGLSPKEIENLTLDKFLEGMLADILSGKELTTKKISGEVKLSYEKGQDLIEQSGKRKEMTEDDKGNYLFFHYSNKKFNKLSPEKVGTHLATGRDERTGIPTSSLYTRPDRLEPNVPSDFGYITRVPKEKVYSFDADPLNLMAEAEARFKKENKDRAFDANNQFAYVAKVAAEKGFPVTVAEWNIKGTKALIAKTTEALPLEKYTNIKAGTTNQIEYAKGTEDIKPNAKRRDIKFQKESQDAKIKDFIEMQREKGISDEDIRAGLEKAADRIGLDKNKIDELLTTKKEEYAVQEPSPEGILQPTQEGVGKERGERAGMEQAEQGAVPPKEGKPSEAEVGGAEEKVGITKKDLKQLEEDYEIDLSKRREKITDVEMQDMAKNLINSGYDVAKLVEKSLKEEKYVPTDLELNILAEQAADMKAKIDANSSNADIAKYRDILSAINRGTSEAGRALRMAQVKKDVVDSIADVMSDMMDDYNVNELTKEQRVEAEARFKVIEDSLNQYKETLDKVNAELEKLKAEKALQDLAQQNKRDTPAKRAKTNEDYTNERKVIIASIKEKWNKASKGGAITAVPLPFSQQLAAIAPDVAKLIGSYLEQGAAKTLDEVRSLLKKDIEDIGIKVTDEEVSRLIAGEGVAKKETKNELARQRYEIQEEQRLLLELERLEEFGEPKTERERIQKNQKLADLRNKIKNLTGENLDEKFIRTANQRIKANETKLNKIQEKLKAGDFSKETKPQSVLDNELLQEKNKKLYEAYLKSVQDKDEAMLNYERARINDKIKNETKLNKIGRYADISLSTSKGTVAMFDQSTFLVQMLPFTLSHPSLAVKFAKEALLKDFISADRFKRTMAILHESPLYDLIEKTGLAVFEPRSYKSELRTELHGGEKNLWNKEFEFKGKKYSVGQAFERSTTSFMNNARISLFMDRVQKLYEAGKTFENSPEEFKSAARVINEFTGQGKLQKHIQMASPIINRIIWSPKMFASTLNVLGLGDIIRPIETAKAMGRGLGFKIKETDATKGFYSSLTPEQRKFALKELSRFIGMGVTIMIIAKLNGADDIDVDPRSSGFGTITSGNKSYNVFGRFASAARTIVQVGGGVRMLGGKEDVLGDKFGDKTAGDVLYGSFGRGKMTPAAGLTSDLILNNRKNYFTKEEIDLTGAAKSLAIPLAAQDIKKDFSRDDVLTAAGTTIAKLYGASISDKRDFEAKMKSKSKRGTKVEGQKRGTKVERQKRGGQ